MHIIWTSSDYNSIKSEDAFLIAVTKNLSCYNLQDSDLHTSRSQNFQFDEKFNMYNSHIPTVVKF